MVVDRSVEHGGIRATQGRGDQGTKTGMRAGHWGVTRTRQTSMQTMGAMSFRVLNLLTKKSHES